MRFLIFGAGAIGAYTGGSLLLGGNEVCFLERSPSAEVLREKGIQLTVRGEKHAIKPVQVASNLPEALDHGPFDAAILAVKSYDTPSVIEELTPLKERIPPILCLQNGVENESLLAEALGPEKVIAGTVTSSIGKPGVGEIVVERQRGIGIAEGRLLAASLAEALSRAGIPVLMYPDALSMKWSKMLTNLPANASSAILDMTPAEILAHPGLFRMEMEMLREALRLMQALGLHVEDLPGVPVRGLAFAASKLPLPAARLVLQRGLGAGRGGKMPSFHIDLHSGKGRSEVDALNGAVVRFARMKGLQAPVNQVLNETLMRLTHGDEDPADYARQPGKLLKLAGIA